MLMQIANHSQAAANDAKLVRDRTVPVLDTITTVPGYPNKLVVFKISASKYWQVRCWHHGRTHRRSTRTTSLRQAQRFARWFYEDLMTRSVVLNVTSLSTTESAAAALSPQLNTKEVAPDRRFAAVAAQMYANEQARVDRGEFSLRGLQVLKNRLDGHILPRWASLPIDQVGFQQLQDFVHFLSKSFSSITISQYLVVVRKVLNHALRVGMIEKLPEFPAIKVHTRSRGAFTPSEYWRIIRTARKLRGLPHPLSQHQLRQTYKLRFNDSHMPPDLPWAIGFMVNSFIRPSDLKFLKHRHVEVVRGKNTYLRLTLPETKKHDAPIVSLRPAVRIYQQLKQHYSSLNRANPDDYLFLPKLRDRNYALALLSTMFNWVLDETGLKLNAHGQSRSMYSLRHSAITFRLLYGSGIDLLTLARNARTSVEVINNHYASTVMGEQNIAMLQSRRGKR
jgi:hypothetical protein